MSPAERHRALIASGLLAEDPFQRHAVELLDDLHQRLGRRRQRPLLKRWLARPEAETGLYLWGGVGRGKTFLMDLFFTTLATEQKRRTHFHRMMSEVHRRLKELNNVEDPLDRVAASIAASGRTWSARTR